VQIESIPITKIKPALYNPRKDLKPGDLEYEKLKRSIDTWDVVEPIVWNKRTGNLVGGHQRLKIYKARGDKKADVSVVDLDDANEKALNIALNKISGDWDFSSLADLLLDLDQLGVDLDVTGFDAGEIEDLMTWTPDGEVKEDDFNEEPPEKPLTQVGDLYELGRHRLLCGDATVVTDVENLLGGSTATLCFTSPPYSDQRSYTKDGDLSPSHLAQFIPASLFGVEYFAVNLGVSRKGGVVDCYWGDYIKIAEGCDLGLLSWNVWSKTGGFSVGRLTAMFPIQHEFIFVFGKTKRKLKPTVPNENADANVVSTDRDRDGVIGDSKRVKVRMHRELGTVLVSPPVDKNDKHPASFPITLPAEYIKAFGGDVYDPFSGSGTTIIAAEQLGCRCYGMEISPQYVDVAVRRYAQFKEENPAKYFKQVKRAA